MMPAKIATPAPLKINLFWNKYYDVMILNFKFSTSVAKGLELKVRTFWELPPTFVDVTGK